MLRIMMVLMVAAVLAIGSVAAAFAQELGQPGESTGWSCPGWGGGGGQGSNDPASNPALKQLADKMGISVEDLATELKAGKSVADVAKEKNVDLQTLVDTLNAPRVEMMNLGVKYGYHTREQADAMQKQMAKWIKYQLEQKGFQGGYGWGPGMMGGGMMAPGADGFRGTSGPGMRGFRGMMGSGMGGFGGMMGPGFMFGG